MSPMNDLLPDTHIHVKVDSNMATVAYVSVEASTSKPSVLLVPMRSLGGNAERVNVRSKDDNRRSRQQL